MTRRHFLLGCAAAFAPAASEFPGTTSTWKSGVRFDFPCAGRSAIVVAPREPAAGRPWLWRGQFFGAFATVDEALLARGWHVAYLECRDMFGSPEAMRLWSAFYEQLTTAHR